jgi:hypothetical protein
MFGFIASVGNFLLSHEGRLFLENGNNLHTLFRQSVNWITTWYSVLKFFGLWSPSLILPVMKIKDAPYLSIVAQADLLKEAVNAVRKGGRHIEGERYSVLRPNL